MLLHLVLFEVALSRSVKFLWYLFNPRGIYIYILYLFPFIYRRPGMPSRWTSISIRRSKTSCQMWVSPIWCIKCWTWSQVLPCGQHRYVLPGYTCPLSTYGDVLLFLGNLFKLEKTSRNRILGAFGWHAQVTGQHIEDSAGSDGFQCGQNGGTQPNGWPCVHLVMPSPGEANLVVHGAAEGQPPWGPCSFPSLPKVETRASFKDNL